MPESSDRPGAGPLILLVDDDRLVLMTLSQQLQAAGYQVIEADNGDDAILLARQYRPRLALLDMRMDGKSGLDVALYMRDYVGTPFLFLSAFGDDALVDRAMRAGAVDYLFKPIEPTRIIPAIERAIERTAATWGQEPEWRPGRMTPDADFEATRLIAIGMVMARCGLSREQAASWIAIRTVQEAISESECVNAIVEGRITCERDLRRVDGARDDQPGNVK
ncbi:MAG: response regulator [Lautropia sp.]